MKFAHAVDRTCLVSFHSASYPIFDTDDATRLVAVLGLVEAHGPESLRMVVIQQVKHPADLDEDDQVYAVDGDTMPIEMILDVAAICAVEVYPEDDEDEDEDEDEEADQ